MAKNAEVQVEYLRHHLYARRFIDNYNIHVFQKAHEHAGLTFHRGITFTRPQGYTTEDNIRRDSDAVGLVLPVLFAGNALSAENCTGIWSFPVLS